MDPCDSGELRPLGQLAHEIDLLTCNIWLRPPPFLDGQNQRVPLLVDCLTGHDLVVVCEAFDQQLSAKLFAGLLPEYPFQAGPLDPIEGLASTEGSGKLWSGGVAILSRWPFRKIASRSFSGLLGHPDMHANKGVLYACIDKLGRHYHVFGAHTQASPESYVRLAYRLTGRNAADQFIRYRLSQFDRIAAFVSEQRIPSSEPVVIAGDLNVDRLGDRPQFQTMLDRLNASMPEVAPGVSSTIDPAANPLANGPHSKWIDYALWSQSHLRPKAAHLEARPLRAATPWRRFPLGKRYYDLSDHYAVRGWFLFPG